VKYKINYGNKVAIIPEKALDKLSAAGEGELRTLFYLCMKQGDVGVEELASLVRCSEDEVKEAVSFWRGAGIVETVREKEKSSDANEVKGENGKATEKKKSDPDSDGAVKTQKKPILKSQDELPKYTSMELADILESRQETVTLIEECQNIMGKIFNVKEINVLIGFVDYLGLDCEYIMMLLTYCASIGKKTLHYAEKTAFALYDMGITDAAQLSEELKRRESVADAEGKIRSLFGIGARAFTTKEKKFISSWINDMNYSIEIIEKAYEVTADATGNASMPYANSILERWNAASLRTLEEIEESYYKAGEGKAAKEGSFDTDSFFEAAVRRSLGED
jgi:DnaD/phage-associated family protein